MGRILKFREEPAPWDLEGLEVDGANFFRGKGNFNDNACVMVIHKAFRFYTVLEVAENQDGEYFLIMTQILTRGVDYWDMEAAFDRIGFRNPEIEKQMRDLCQRLIEKNLADWVEDDE